MSEISIIEGEIYIDSRGKISSLNNFLFEDICRLYFIKHDDTSIVRGWHAHQFEKKWFYCVQGSFTLAFVKIDNWETPSLTLEPQIYNLSDKKSQIICLPEGYANCLKASEPNSILLVFSDKEYQAALADSWRYDSSLWVDWSNYKF